ncbi:hypothetical protein KV679_20090 [Bacillus sp. JRC01]|nr:hypothetical protein [Bacillus sp. JRC01]
MKWLIPMSFVFLLLAGCGSEEKSYELCGYGDMLVLNGKGYMLLPVKKTLTLDGKAGVIKEKIGDEFHPEKDYTANHLKKGTDLYYVKDHSNYLIANTSDERYLLYEEIEK